MTLTLHIENETSLADGGPLCVSIKGERGLDIGRDRGSPVSHYESPFAFTGKLNKVTVTMDDDQVLDGDGIGRAQLARE